MRPISVSLVLVLTAGLAFAKHPNVAKDLKELAQDPDVAPITPFCLWPPAKAVGADGKEVINAINCGSFFGGIVDFVVIAFCIYLIANALIREAPAPPPPPSKTCPPCKESNAVDATRCKACTSDI